MKFNTIKTMYNDYLDYQKYYKKELDWELKETFKEYILRSIQDEHELDIVENLDELEKGCINEIKYNFK
jgi:hypothetical protein